MAGRPKANIDWDKVGKLLQAGCDATGIAGLIGCDRDTLYIRCQRDLKKDFSAFRQEKVAEGDELLRSKQFATAMAGNVTMQIWLGKQRLGQKDKHEHSGPDDGPIQIATFQIATRPKTEE
jgi:hypothetical protein